LASIIHTNIWGVRDPLKIDTELDSSIPKPPNYGAVFAGSNSALFVPDQPPTPFDICIQPKVLYLNDKGQIIISRIRLPIEYDPHDIDSDSLELSVLSCPKCEIIPPSWQFPSHGKYLIFFQRQNLIDKLKKMDLDFPAKLNLKVSGELNNGTPFEGLETIWIFKQK
jgi:hypothetical protein